MTKRLIEIREELALHLDKTADLHPVMGYTHSKAFKDGFNTAWETLLPLLNEAMAALDSLCVDWEKYSIEASEECMNLPEMVNRIKLHDNAKKALAHIRETLGEE